LVLCSKLPLERIAEAFSINEQYADGVGKMVLV
jgi:hypothetical protein